MPFGDTRIAWCSRCVQRAPRRGVYSADGSLVGEADPICPRCMFRAELVEPADLEERNRAAQAAAVARELTSAGSRASKPSTSDSSLHVSKREAGRILKIGRSGANNTLDLLIKSGRLKPVSFLGKQVLLREDILRLAKDGVPPADELRGLSNQEAPKAKPRQRKSKVKQPTERLEDWQPPKRR